MRYALLFLAGVAPTAVLSSQSIPFKASAVVTGSVRFQPGHYFVATGDSSVALIVRGSDIVVDLTGVELDGNHDHQHPDRYRGTAIRIEGGRNITLKGLHARGFKLGIVARGVRGLRLLDNDLSYNWKPRLYSGIERESLVDWLDYHQDDKDEWLRYGAGIYLADVTGGEVRGNTVVQGMNGLLLLRTDGLRIWNNTFSYNSGLGVGLYRSSSDSIMHNRIDWDVRGYSHGFYNRGQDSAGLLIYEQSCNNVVAYNSVTHGGDGLFLWAGQHTMDTGEGGANDNLFYRNDFSFAPTNGMEATFSRNRFVDNRVKGNWHGLWGGYSFNSLISGNQFSDNVEAIAIEHGQDNTVLYNTFDGDTIAIHLWWNRIEPSDWGYPKHRDTRSRDYLVDGNVFTGSRVAMRIDNTQRYVDKSNEYRGVDTMIKVSGDTTGWISVVGREQTRDQDVVARLPGGIDPGLKPTDRQGRSTIIVDEWGPYDWKSPKLWPAGRDDRLPLALRVLGPPGRWRVVARNGVEHLSRESGSMGDTLVVTPATGHEGDFAVDLEYRGGAVVTPNGERVAAGRPVRFSWHRFVPAATWHVRFVTWDSARTPLADRAAMSRAFGAAPVAELDTNRLDLTWYGPPRKTIPQANVLTEATATLRLEPGNYVLRTIADDAVRVYIDDRLVLDDWTPGDSHAKEATFTATGSQRFRVEHLQVGGWYELRVDIEKGGN